MPKLKDLPDIDFVNISEAEVKRELFALYTTITGRTLADGDPVRLFILFIANIVILLLNKLNDTGKMNLLKYSKGEYLENLGAIVGTTRMGASTASTIVQITLSAAREKETIIPAGTRVSPENNVYFAIEEDVVIAAGQTVGQALAYCTEAGTVGNGYAAGEINIIVDPIAYVASIVNISKSEGGAEVEADDNLRERIFEAPESYSCAGSEGAYTYHAKSVSSAIIDAVAISPAPGEVQVAVLLTNGAVPEGTVLQNIKDMLSARTVRPLTDKLTVTAPEIVPYDLNVRYWIEEGADASEVATNVAKTIEAYKMWQCTKIGRDINPDEIVYRMKAVAGVKRVNVISPGFTILSRIQVAQNIKTNVAMEGSEDE